MTVLVPSSWGPSPPCPALGTLGDAAGESWEAADLRVSKGRHPHHGARPWTLHSRGCGHRGDYVSLGHQSLTANASTLAGTSSVVLVQSAAPRPLTGALGGPLPSAGLQAHHRHSPPPLPRGQRSWLGQVARQAASRGALPGGGTLPGNCKSAHQALDASHSSGMIIAQLPLRGRKGVSESTENGDPASTLVQVAELSSLRSLEYKTPGYGDAILALRATGV